MTDWRERSGLAPSKWSTFKNKFETGCHTQQKKTKKKEEKEEEEEEEEEE